MIGTIKVAWELGGTSIVSNLEVMSWKEEDVTGCKKEETETPIRKKAFIYADTQGYGKFPYSAVTISRRNGLPQRNTRTFISMVLERMEVKKRWFLFQKWLSMTLLWTNLSAVRICAMRIILKTFVRCNQNSYSTLRSTKLEFVGFKFPKLHSLDLCSWNDGCSSHRFCDFSRQKAR